MMKDVTRREFLNTAAGAAVGSSVIGRSAFLNAAVVNTPSAIVDPGRSKYAGSRVSLESIIFPKPQKISNSGSDFIVDNQVRIVVPPNASQEDLFLARSLANELGDRFDLHLKIEKATSLTRDARVILMGSI